MMKKYLCLILVVTTHNNGIENKRSIHTNLEEVYDKILNENIKENTDVILGKMESIAYLFGE